MVKEKIKEKTYRVCRPIVFADPSTNLTPQNMAQENMAQENSALQNIRLWQMAQFKASLLARTSHELRSPLSSLISFHQLILNDLCDSPGEERQCVQEAYEAAKRLLAMLETVTHLSKLEFGSVPLKRESLCLHTLLENFQGLIHLQVANRNLRLHIDFPEPTVWIVADGDCLQQALMCLIDPALRDRNALQVQIRTVVDRTNQTVKLQIQDHRPQEAFQEAIDLLQQPPLTPQALSKELLLDQDYPGFQHLSGSLMLSIAQTYLELMQGRLELVEGQAMPGETDSPGFALQLHSTFARSRE
jgi:signal transduction histidine kinase